MTETYRGTWVVASRDLLTFVGDRVRLLASLACPLLFLAGVFFPVDRVPRWLAVLSTLTPLTYAVDAVRQVVLGAGPAGAGLGVTGRGHTMTLGEEVALVGALGLVLVVAAAWAFGRQE